GARVWSSRQFNFVRIGKKPSVSGAGYRNTRVSRRLGVHSGTGISIHVATTKCFSNSFVFKNKIEKEGLPSDRPAGLGAGGPRFKSGRPDHQNRRDFWVPPALRIA